MFHIVCHAGRTARMQAVFAWLLLPARESPGFMLGMRSACRVNVNASQVPITLSYLIKAHKSKHGDAGQFITIWCLLLLVAVHLLLCPVYTFNFLITVYIEEHIGHLGVSTILNLSIHSPSHSLCCPRAAGRQRLWLKPAQQRLQVSPQVWCWHLHRNLSTKAKHVWKEWL